MRALFKIASVASVIFLLSGCIVHDGYRGGYSHGGGHYGGGYHHGGGHYHGGGHHRGGW